MSKGGNRILGLALTVLGMVLLMLVTSSCNETRKKYVIGVSQCSEDSWRNKLKAELEQSTYFNEDVELRMCFADDDDVQQSQQIDSLVKTGIDLLVVSPNQVKELSGSVEKVVNKGIPVILYDRKTSGVKYSAFMGADNFAIGKMMGEYAAGQLGGQGCIAEIGGLHGSSPARERHEGFMTAVKKYPGLKIIGYAEGDWKEASGETAMEEILENYDGKIDCVFGGNDRMAVGARKALERHAQTHPGTVIQPSTILYLGVDALPTAGGGIEHVRDGVLSASAIYPTKGDMVMALALNILRGEVYEKETMMETSIVTAANANVLLMQYKEVENQAKYINKMHNRVNTILGTVSRQRIFLILCIVVFAVVCCLFAFALRANRQKHALNAELRRKNEELNTEKEVVERQRDELELQRDKLIEATLKNEDSGNEVLSGDENIYKQESEFMKRFNACVEKHMIDSDLSVEDLGAELCLSRVQLYRKVKALTGKSPVEIVREMRLQRAHQLLSDSSLTISEIAYRVGFSSPSYFTKCYKDQFGTSPTKR